ncbi:Olfactory receptor 4K17 [Heterocephalus glaber]|uniref:Olfactory receptor n=1 Tax=Heterocephalus glaber TaxID=10181 RepID=G5C739_HETGA|nr:olfactory receptor 4K17 [Heterocephalus glaber]EHB17350.1 Olfactory receptor 4K17 [Heterocephalus glaber]
MKKLHYQLRRSDLVFLSTDHLRANVMEPKERLNQSQMSEFILMGLTSFKDVEFLLLGLFSVIYVITLLGNLLIVVMVFFTPNLNTPMYFLLGNLSFVDMTLATFATPKMIANLVKNNKTISFAGCFTQIFLLHFLGAVEMVLLVSMGYDRYVAICQPLHYMTIMRKKVCILLVVISWFSGLVHSGLQLPFVISLPFCGPNVVDSIFCDLPLVTKLGCTDTYFVQIVIVANSGTISVSCFIILLVSYSLIFRSIRKLSSAGQSKAHSTLIAHITVVILFFGPCVFIYIWPFSNHSLDKFLAVFYTIITPILNPIIYTLRNKEMKTAMKKIWRSFVSSREET